MPVSTDDVLSLCKQLEIRLWAEDGKLRFDAPKGAIDVVRDALVERKGELIELLTAPVPLAWPELSEIRWGPGRTDEDAGPGLDVHPPAEVGTTEPLADVEAAVELLEQIEDRGVVVSPELLSNPLVARYTAGLEAAIEVAERDQHDVRPDSLARRDGGPMKPAARPRRIAYVPFDSLDGPEDKLAHAVAGRLTVRRGVAVAIVSPATARRYLGSRYAAIQRWLKGS